MMGPNTYPNTVNPYYMQGYPPQIPQISYPTTPFARSVIPGRAVSDVDDINPSEVPNDGTLGIFPKNDGSAIYVKSLGNDGIITNKVYIPAPEGYTESKVEAVPQVTLADIMDQLTNIQDTVDELKKQRSYNKNHYNKNNQNNRQNKNEQGDEINA